MRRTRSAFLTVGLALGASTTDVVRAQGPDTGAVATAAAQSGRWVPARASRAQPLQRRIQLRLASVPLAEALGTIARSGGLKLGYSGDVRRARVRVSLETDDMTVLAALMHVLDGTGFEPFVSLRGDAVLVSASPPVPDQESGGAVARAFEHSVQHLEEVVVTGIVAPTEVKALPTPVSVITADEIALLRPRSLAELFRQTVPGAVAWNIPSAPFHTAFSVRGANTLDGGTAQLKLLLDGVEVANSMFAAVDPASIERIEVVRGPQAAAVYGPEAIGGVLQIFTKRGDASRARPEVSGEAAVGLLETPYAGYRGVLRHEYAAAVRGHTSGVSYQLGGGYAHTGDYVPGGERSAQSAPSIYGGLRFTRGILSVDFSGRFYAQHAPSYILNPELLESGYIHYTKPFYLGTEVRNQTYGLRLNLAPTRWWRHTVNAGIDAVRLSEEQTQPRLTQPWDTSLALQYQTQRKRSIGYSTSIEGSLGSGAVGTFTAGFDHYDLPVHTRNGYTYSDRDTTGRITTFRAIRSNTGYFAQAQFAIREVLFLTGGLRADELVDPATTQVSPRVGLAYLHRQGAATLKLRGSYGSATRRLMLAQGRGTLPAGAADQTSSPPDPERQRGWDVGLDVGVGSRGSLSLTYYDQTADDLIQWVTIEGIYPAIIAPVRYENVGRVRNTGVEAEGTLMAGPLRLRGQYGYARARFEQLSPRYWGDLQVGDQMLATPRHIASAMLGVAPRSGATLALGLTYVGSWRQYDRVAQARCYGQTGPCQDIPCCRSFQWPYITAYPAMLKINVTARQRLAPALWAFVAIDNATDTEAHELSNVYPVTGRATTIGLRMSY